MLAVGKNDIARIQALLRKMNDELILAQLEVDLRGRWELFKQLPPEEQWRLIEETGEQLEEEGEKSPDEKSTPEMLGPDDPPSAHVSLDFKKKYDEIIEQWSKRLPVIKRNYREVQQAYQGDKAFSIAGESHMKVLREVQDSLGMAMAEGKSRETWERDAPEHWPKFRATMENIFRTNMATSYAAGRIAAARDSDIVGFKRLATRDSDVRENHLAADGLYWSLNPAWDNRGIGFFSLPFGYQCRCTDRPITRREADRLNLLDDQGRFMPPAWPADAHPDHGFEASPVERLYRG